MINHDGIYVGMCSICTVKIYAGSSYELRTKIAWHKLTHSPDDFKTVDWPKKELLIF